MKLPRITTELIRLLTEAVADVLNVYLDGQISWSPTVQKVKDIRLKPEISSFLLIYGHYTILIVINFTKEAAEYLYTRATSIFQAESDNYHKHYASEEVINFISEIVNQIAGQLRRKVEQHFHKVAQNSQPKAFVVTSEIRLYLKTSLLHRYQCWKLTFRDNKHNPFYVEFSFNPDELKNISH
jgi:CheY-specific phosphatase CheX